MVNRAVIFLQTAPLLWKRFTFTFTSRGKQQKCQCTHNFKKTQTPIWRFPLAVNAIFNLFIVRAEFQIYVEPLSSALRKNIKTKKGNILIILQLSSRFESSFPVLGWCPGDSSQERRAAVCSHSCHYVVVNLSSVATRQKWTTVW